MNKSLPSLSQLTATKPIRLILSDYDGTFTNHNNEIPCANVEGFCLARKLGIQVGLATGRGLQSAIEGLGQNNSAVMKYNGFPGVFCNGSVVYGKEGEKVVDVVFPSSVQKQLLDALKRRGLLRFVMGLTAGDSYCCEYNGWTLVCYSRFSEAKPLLLPEEEGLYTREFNKFMLWQQNEDLEVVRKELEKELGITPEEVLVVGDSENDVPMMQAAGIAVAVADAAETAKTAANYLTVGSGEGPLLHIVKVLQEKGLCPKHQK
ncbi:hypothetical protein Efla_002222 [Eimeria flavescens]